MLWHRVISVFLVYALAVVQAQRITTGLQSLYLFQEGSGLLSRDAVSTSATLGNLTIDPLTASFATDSVGIVFNKGPSVVNSATGAEPVTSTLDDTALLNVFNQNQQFTWEVWIQPSSTTQIGVIASLGIDGTFPGIAVTCPGMHFEQSSTSLIAYFTTSDGTCYDFPHLTLNSGSHRTLNLSIPIPVQFVISYNTGTVTITATQGSSTGSKVYGPSVTSFNNTALFPIAKLYFAPQYAPTAQVPTQAQVWQGKILMSALYSTALSTSDIAQNYNAWIANSPPIATNVTLVTNQNTPLTFTLTATDFDILYAPPAIASAQLLNFTIVRSTANGTLVRQNGANSYLYTPFPYVYGVGVDSFTFKPFDGISYGAVATATITINHVELFLTPRVSTGLQSMYIFTEGSGQIARDYTGNASPLGDLTIDPVTASFATDSVGINFNKGAFSVNSATGAEPVTSARNDTALLNTFAQTQQFTWEIWLQPASGTAVGVIASLGPLGVFPGDGLSCPGLYLVQAASAFFVQMSYTGGGCDQFQPNLLNAANQFAANLSKPAPVQMVVTYNAGVVVLINTQGTSVSKTKTYTQSDTTFNDSSSFTSSNLYFAPQYAANAQDPAQVRVWQGKILFSALYNRALSPSDIAQNYNAWLPNSPPVAISTTLSVNQNTPFDITLTATDFDVLYGPSAVVASQATSFTIVRGPFNGTLSPWSDGIHVTYTSFPYVYGTAVDSFTFKAFDGRAYGPIATATINVNHVELFRSPRVTTGLQSLYLFNEGSGQISRDYMGNASPLGNLVLDPLTASFANDSVGINLLAGSLFVDSTAGAQPVKSTYDSTVLSNTLGQSQQFTWELWVQPANSLQQGIIASIGPIGAYPGTVQTCPGFYIKQNTISLTSFVTSDVSTYTCRTLLYNPFNTASQQVINFTLAAPIQYVVAYTPGSVVVTVTQNNQTTFTDPISVHTNFTNPGVFTPGNLVFGPQYPGNPDVLTVDKVWQGKVLLSAIYNTALSVSDAVQNYNAWLPNSLPIALNTTLTINQYSSLNFTLNATDFDVIYGPPATVASQPINFTIIKGPVNGTITVQPGGVYFVYTSFPNVYGTGVDSFTFKAFDGHAYGPIATVIINVNHVELFHSPRVSTGLQSLYLFIEGAGQVARDFVTGVSPLGDLTIDPLTAAFATDSIGVSFAKGGFVTNPATGAEPVSSAYNDTSLLAAIRQQQAFTWEIWIQAAVWNQTGVIAALGPIGLFPGSLTCPGAYIKQQNGALILVMNYYTSGGSSCLSYTMNPRNASGVQVVDITNPAPIQVTVVFNSTTVSFTLTQYGQSGYYIQVAAVDTTVPASFTPAQLFFAPQYAANGAQPTQVQVWQGKVLLNALYNTALNSTDIATNYNAWLPNSIPVPQNVNLTIRRNNVLNFTLAANDFDLLYAPSTTQTLSYRIVTPPQGTITGGPVFFRYTPPLDYIGPDNFTFQASDGLGWSRTSAFVAITVLRGSPINNPFFSSRVSSQLQSLYLFTEGGGSSASDSVSTPATLGSLTLDPLTAAFATDSIGVSFASGAFVTNPATGAEPITSANLDTSLLSTFSQNQQFSWEIWIQPASQTQVGVISALGPIGTFPGNSPTCPGVYIQQAGNIISARMSQAGNTCHEFLPTTYNDAHQLILNFTSASPIQFTFTYNTGTVSVTVAQGTSSAVATYTSYLTAFNDTSIFTPSKVGFSPQYAANGAQPAQVQVWQGKVLLSAIYSTALNITDVANNYNAWLPNSQPYITAPIPINVTENTPNNTTFTANDFDILYAPAVIQALQQLSYRIVTLPARGTLYYNLNNTQVRITTAPFALPLLLSTITYLPGLNGYGTAYDSFTYQASDGYVWSTSATQVINVVHVNQPPVAVSNTQTTIARVPTLIVFNNTDPDALDFGDYLASVTLWSLPGNRSLLCTTIDGTTCNTTVSSAPFILNATATVVPRLLFTSIDPPSSSNGLAEVMTTSLSFSLTDSYGTASVSRATLSLSILNYMQATSLTLSTIGDIPLSIQLVGYDLTGGNVSYYVTNTTTLHGSLSALNSSLPIPRGNVTYRVTPGYSGIDSFTYYVMSTTGVQSARATVAITVIYANHPPTLTLAAITSNASLVAYIANSVSEPSLALPVQLGSIDPDHVFRAVITTTGVPCLLSLTNTSAAALMTFTIGTATASPTMIFTGLRSNMYYAIASLIVAAFDKGFLEVDIAVNDQYSGNPYQYTTTLPITMLIKEPSASSGSSSSSSSLSLTDFTTFITFILYGGIACIALVFAYTVWCFCRTCFGCCRCLKGHRATGKDAVGKYSPL